MKGKRNRKSLCSIKFYHDLDYTSFKLYSLDFEQI